METQVFLKSKPQLLTVEVFLYIALGHWASNFLVISLQFNSVQGRGLKISLVLFMLLRNNEGIFSSPT